MARYLVTRKISTSCGVEAESRKEAQEQVEAELQQVVERLNRDEKIGLGVRFELREWDSFVEELPF